MHNCENCFWYDKCPEKGKLCEDYDPVIGSDYIDILEYERNLKERVEEYQQIMEEFND